MRGEGEVAEAQVIALRQQIESLRVSIEWQIRSAMLDVQSSNELVKVARSNVDLATQEVRTRATDLRRVWMTICRWCRRRPSWRQAQSRLVRDAVSVQPIEADAGEEYGRRGVAVQGLSGTVVGFAKLSNIAVMRWGRLNRIGYGLGARFNISLVYERAVQSCCRSGGSFSRRRLVARNFRQLSRTTRETKIRSGR